MPNADGSPEFWKRTSAVLATLLSVAVIMVCGLIAMLTWKVKAHDLELKAARAQFERERETAIKMWQATDAALKRERKGSVGRRGGSN